MDLQGYLAHLNAGKPVVGGSEVHAFMYSVSQEAIRVTMEMRVSSDIRWCWQR